MASALLVITQIRPESARYVEKDMCGWYTMHAPGAGMKCCCVPEVGYLG